MQEKFIIPEISYRKLSTCVVLTQTKSLCYIGSNLGYINCIDVQQRHHNRYILM